jgi:hypothetical protein
MDSGPAGYPRRGSQSVRATIGVTRVIGVSLRRSDRGACVAGCRRWWCRSPQWARRYLGIEGGAVYGVWRVHTAQTIRANLLARATAATLWAAPLFRPECPGAQRVRGGVALRVAQDRAGALGQQHAQVRVPLLADRTQAPALSRRVFASGEAQMSALT